MTSESAYSSSAENTAREYYNSDDADNFYYTIWGGEDLHLGIYEAGDEGIFAASRRTVDRMVGRLARLEPGMKLLDVGSGFGGSARHLARTRGCHVTCLNISEKENARNRKMNQEQGLAHLIEVKDGSFEDIPFPDNTFDV
ncbi:MAG: class I SAM-dependent methyltransferase, partial [Pseudomonadota bacterium]